MQNSSDIKFANELFQNYEQIMFKIAYNILKNNFDAEDAVQDAFFWIINNIEKIRNLPCEERVLYFSEIAEHTSIDILRKKKRHPIEDIDEMYDICYNDSVEEKALDKMTVEKIRDALDELSNRDYDLLYLYLFKEMSYQEISEAIGITENNVRVYIHRARKRFIKILKKRGVIDDL